MSEPLQKHGVRGQLHRPEGDPVAGLVLTHGAGSNCDTKLLQAVADGFVKRGVLVLRFDLPFRQRRESGPPHPSRAPEDREGVAEAVAVMRDFAPGPVWAGGHSYGGRQASMLAAERPGVVDALLLLSYPLHPPAKPENLRTDHLPNLHTPAVIVHGSKDPFATTDEIRSALELIPAAAILVEFEGARHDLAPDKFPVVDRAVAAMFGLR
ncbi:alpha/beta hydrolase family protein [Rhodococcus tibetensis]|uniref:Alpha/beta fold hydrolase n=1 Tax=Rhodococcus tibetensis TaxID=2965064 RepID=A0ABT1QH23_9NOCA|nr:alpha/beta fold hydrolase [Rhodococcus sp. FXJ9.536]MCQ4121492.1 alpha/beta fold hydrolase [Rhodococcus sp. FXJ9.536]